MLTTVAVLPQPPLLVPELATAAAAETAPLRAACLTAATRLGAAARRWIAVGADEGGRRTVGSLARGTFVGFGVDVVVALDTTADCGPERAGDRSFPAPAPTRSGPGENRDPCGEVPDPWLPLPLLVAGWAAGAAGVEVTIRGELVHPDAPPHECAALGAVLAGECASDPQPVGLLVVGDGAATHTEKAPRHLDERAAPFDRIAAAALASADVAALAALDAGLATELCAVGRAPWQVLAGATAGGDWDGELLHSDAPFGVAYHVAVWTRRP